MTANTEQPVVPSRVTPKKEPLSPAERLANLTVEPDDLLSFNRRERRHLVSKFDAEFMDLNLYLMQALNPSRPDEEARVIEKIVTVDGERVTADDILIEMLWLIVCRDDPEFPIEAFDDYGLMDLMGFLGSPKDGNLLEPSERP